jgi:hypothetical protein
MPHAIYAHSARMMFLSHMRPEGSPCDVLQPKVSVRPGSVEVLLAVHLVCFAALTIAQFKALRLTLAFVSAARGKRVLAPAARALSVMSRSRLDFSCAKGNCHSRCSCCCRRIQVYRCTVAILLAAPPLLRHSSHAAKGQLASPRALTRIPLLG